MSRCYYLKTDCYVDFIGMQEVLEMLHDEYIVAFNELEPSTGERSVACFYIEGESAQGVHIINKEGCIVIKINSFSNYMDYELARQILTIERDFLKTQIIDEDNRKIVLEEYFTDDNIRKLLEDDGSDEKEEAQICARGVIL